MTGALNALREAVVEQLRQAGVQAVAAMESRPAARWREAVAAVSLAGVKCAPGGFQDYLGVARDGDGTERELYGRAAELTLAIDIFAPRDGGESACQEAAEQVAESLICRGAAGLNALELQTGQTEFLERDSLYRQKTTCRCKAWLIARRGEDSGAFTDFEVRGRLQ